ncbi:UDP-N-acetylmuramoyl-L-alanine--D-glutamate ligase [Alteromonadaceae bacterium M269]|nr:UDP-N-acetylmuramoyl-L-alanine--D-glutamate ligase [Alteromonadaceae bacterium M269]
MTQTLTNKRVVVVGLGLTGLSCVKYLLKQGSQVVAIDQRAKPQADLPQGVDYQFGDLKVETLLNADLIVLSPGVPLALPQIQEAVAANIEVIGDIELFARVNKTPVIAITGSNGKSTVTSLVSMMVEADGKKVITGGNIGQPILDMVDEQADVAVLELSSFQLESTYSLEPAVATVLNVTDDHLDRYDSFAHYQETKLSIYKNAKQCIANANDKGSWPEEESFIQFGQDKDVSFDGQWITYKNEKMLDFLAGNLVGEHNILNTQAAVALAHQVGISKEAMQAGFNRFAGLPHRCQLVAIKKGVSWVNDSKATNVAATIAAIRGLKSGVNGRLHLIAGGDGKGADFRELAPVLRRNVSTLLVMGKDSQKLAAQFPCSLAVHSMDDAVKEVSRRAEDGDMVLLSPACASIDMFDNYQHRGDCFAQAVKELSA